jgi:hypothetical protein
MQDLNNIELINPVPMTAKEFGKLNKKGKYCFQYDKEHLSDDIEDYIDNVCCCVHSSEDLKRVIEKSSKIEVFFKRYYNLTEEELIEYLQDRLIDNGFMEFDEFLENYVGKDLFKKAVKKFNKEFSNYINGKQVGWLDLSKDVKRYAVGYFNEEITKDIEKE